MNVQIVMLTGHLVVRPGEQIIFHKINENKNNMATKSFAVV